MLKKLKQIDFEISDLILVIILCSTVVIIFLAMFGYLGATTRECESYAVYQNGTLIDEEGMIYSVDLEGLEADTTYILRVAFNTNNTLKREDDTVSSYKVNKMSSDILIQLADNIDSL